MQNVSTSVSLDPSSSSGAPLALHEGGYAAHLVNRADAREVEACERLRYEEFVARRTWVAADLLCPERERDHYDLEALHMAVFAKERVVAYLRVIERASGCGFMLEHEFSSLLGAGEREELGHKNTVEVSRLALAPSLQGRSASQSEGRLVMELLLKLLYRESLAREWSRFYLVTEAGWLRLFARRFGLVFQTVGRPCAFSDGTSTVAALTTLAAVEESVTGRFPEKADWYRSA